MTTITLQPTDTVITGAGNDTLILNGSSASYIVERMENGYRLIDISDANLGRDINAVLLSGIETLQFSDRSDAISQFAGESVNGQGTDIHDGSGVTNANGAIFNGGSGNDTITGSNSVRDIAIFSGNLSDYWISSVDGKLQVRDLRPSSPDGVDNIVDVEFLRFADKTISMINSGYLNRSEGIGTDQDNKLESRGNEMLFIGGGGNDKIRGSDNDIVVYSGAKSDYVITKNSDGSFTVNDRRDLSPDGVDVVYGVKEFRFSDGIFYSNANDFTSQGTITSVRYGTSAANKLTGTNTSGNDLFYGYGGNDTLDGAGGHDQLFGGDGKDSIKGGIGHDFIEGGASADTMDGGVGSDTLSYATSNASVSVNLATNRVSGGHATGDKIKGFENIEGSEFSDNLTGSSSVNIINGRGGNDTIQGGGAADILDGGDGIDTLSYSSSKIGVDVDLSLSEASGGDAGSVTSMDRILGFENVTGSAYADTIKGDDNQNTLTGGSGNDRLTGLAGADILNGDAGNDVLIGGIGSDFLYGGTGNDTASYQFASTGVSVTLRSQGQTGGEAEGDQLISIENLDGSEYNDALIGNDVDNVLLGRNGDDMLEGGMGADRLVGGDGNDTATYRNATSGVVVSMTSGSGGEAAGDVLVDMENLEGSNFNDALTGNEKDNSLTGGAGNDRLFGGAGNDTLVGGTGDDLLVGGQGADGLFGGAGHDTVDYSGSAQAVVINLATGTGIGGDAQGDSYSDIQSVIGSGNSDSLTGDDGANRLFGGDGSDILNGGDGDDYIVGGTGADTIDGGDGIDTVDYSASKNLVTINTLKENAASSGGDALGDKVKNVENFILTSGNDAFIGSSINNKVWAGAGNDSLWGMGGDDYLVAGPEILSNKDFNNGNGSYRSSSDNKFQSFGIVGSRKPTMKKVHSETVALASKEEVSGKFAVVEFDIIRVDSWSSSDRIGIYIGDSLISFKAGGTLTSGTVGNMTYKLVETSKANVTGSSSSDRIIHVTLVTSDPMSDLTIGIGGSASKSKTLGFDNLTVIRSDDPGATYKATANEENTLNGGAGSDTLIGSSGADTLSASDGLLVYETFDTMPLGWNNASLTKIGVNDAITPTSKNANNEAKITKTIDIPPTGTDFNTNEYVITEFKFTKLDNWDGDEEVFINVGGKILKFKPDASYQDGDILIGGNPLGADAYQRGEVGMVVTSVGSETYINSGAGTDHVYQIRLIYLRPVGLQKLDISVSVTFNDLLSDESFAISDFVSVISQDFNSTTSTWLNEKNILDGRAGDDEMIASFGADSFIGGAGSDTVDYSASFKGIVARLSATDANGINGAYANTGALGDLGASGDTFNSIENLIGSKFADQVFGSLSGGNYKLGAGDDIFDTADSAKANVVDGGTGNDWIKGSSDADSLTGGDGNDTLHGEGGNDTISAGAGNDNVYGGAGNDQITLTGGGIDSIFGGDGGDTVTLEVGLADVTGISRDNNNVTTITYATGQADIAGTETIVIGSRVINSSGSQGTSADDTLNGSTSDDNFFGFGGNDVLNGGVGADILMGDAGSDTLSYANSTASVRVNLAVQAENSGEAAGDTFYSIENVAGSSFNDTLIGDAGANILSGNGGNDTITGDVINDVNLLRDPSFEDSLAGSSNSAFWTLNSATIQSSATGSSQGTKMLAFNLNAVNLSSSAQQTITTVIGQQYLMSFDIATTANGAVDFIASVMSGNNLIKSQAVNKSGSNFTMVTLVFVATSTSTTIKLANNTNEVKANGVIMIDNVRVNLDGGGSDTLFGGSGNNTLEGRGGNDRLDGGDGNDTILGGTGDDTIVVSAGTDSINGGHGSDTLSLEALSGANTVNLAAGSYTTTVGTGTISDVEGVVGGSGVDTIIGSAKANNLSGGAGNDSINAGEGDDIVEGGAGADTLVGGDGSDTLSYAGSTQSVTVTLGGAVSGGDAEGDTVVGFENLIGSKFDDTLTGDLGDNVITANGGRDVIDGGAGNDTVVLDFNLIDYEFKVNNVDQNEFWFIPRGNTDTTDARWINAIKVSNVEYFKFKDVSMSSIELTKQSMNEKPTDIQLGGDKTNNEGASAGTVLGQLTATDPDTLKPESTESFFFRIVDQSGVTLTDTAFEVNQNGQLIVARPALLDYETATISGTDRIVMVYVMVSDSRGNSIAAPVSFTIKLNNVSGNILESNLTEGTSEEDTITGTIASDSLGGGLGNDTISGFANGDVLRGGGGNDALYGGEGNDTLEGDNGGDLLYGGAGRDTVSYANDKTGVNVNLQTGAASGGEAASDQLFDIEDAIGGDGNDTFVADDDGSYIRGGIGNDTLTGSTGIDVLDGGDNDDTLNGNEGNDQLLGRAGTDSLYGGAGDDELDGGTGADIIDGGDGNDTVLFDNELAAVTVNLSTNTAVSNNVTDTLVSIEIVSGSNFDDDLTGNSDANRLYGRGGADIIRGDASESTGSDDQLYGGSGNDTVYGNAGNDEIEGNADDDKLFGGLGDDTLDGGAGNDELDGGSGDDNLIGGSGNDVISFGNGTDTVSAGADDDIINGSSGNWQSISGGAGNDTLSFATLTSAVNVDLSVTSGSRAVTEIEIVVGGLAGDTITGSAGNEELLGGAGNDTLSGGAGNDTIHGGTGNDIIDGGSGTNILNGNEGNDTILAGAGGNTIDGGEGSDTLSYALSSSPITVVFSAQGRGTITVNGVTDSFSNIESLVGSSGDDTFGASSGSDIFNGGAGSDTVTYSSAGTGIIASLALNRGITGIAAGDSYTNVENLSGSSFSDTLIGSNGSNVLSGGGGNDVLDGYNLLINGSFNQATLMGVIGTSDWFTRVNANLPGWTTSLSPHAQSSVFNNLEMILNGRGELPGLQADGQYALDTENGHGQHIQVSQVVEAPAGEWLTISLDVAGDASRAETLEVFYNNVLIGTISSADLDGNLFESYSWNVQAVQGASLRLVGGNGGTSDSAGLYVDNVRVVLRDAVVSGDVMYGDDGNDQISGTIAADTIYGGGDNDFVAGSDGNDIIYGGTGSDTLTGDSNIVTNLLHNGSFGNQTAWTATSGASSISMDLRAGHTNNHLPSGNHLELDATAGIDSVAQNVVVKAGTSYTLDFQAASRADIWGDTNSFEVIWRVAGQPDRVLATIDPTTVWTEFKYTFQTGTEVGGTIVFRETTGASSDLVGGLLDNVRFYETPTRSNSDSIFGDTGDDVLVGGFGADILNGGDGTDEANYAAETAALTVNLATGTASGGNAQGDTLSLIENLRGGLGADLLGGNAGSNTIWGGNGFDEIHGDGLVTNLFSNHSFETKTSDGTTTGAILKNAVDGWTFAYGGVNSAAQLVYAGTNRMFTAKDGMLAFSMRKDGQNGTLSQVVNNVAEGTVLTISVDLAHERLIDAGLNLTQNVILDVYWGDTLLDTIDRSYDTILSTNWSWFQTFSWQVTAGSDAQSNTLRFVERGTGTTYGTLIDNVKVYETGQGGNDTLYGDSGSDTIDGGAGNDTVYGGLHEDGLHGNTGNDTIFGGDGIDQLFGGHGNDTLRGGWHDDTMFGGDGADDLYGDGDSDRLYGGAGNDVLNGGAGNDTLVAGLGHDALHGDDGFDSLGFEADVTAGVTVNTDLNTYSGTGFDGIFTNIEQIIGTKFADTMIGGDGNDIFIGGDGNDTITGGAGNDLIEGGLGTDDLDGGDGIDTLRFAAVNNAGITWTAGSLLTPGGDTYRNFERYQGTRWGDSLTGSSGAESFLGGDGNDTISGLDGDDILDGEADNDTISGGNGNDMIYGGTGADTLTGDAGNDEMFGGSQNDNLSGGAGADKLYGGDDADILQGSEGADIMDGGNGADYVEYINSTAGVTIVLNSTGSTTGIGGDAEGDTLIGIEHALGSNHSDTITGDMSNNTIRGANGNDFLYGGAGDDTIGGGDGNDTMDGGAGNDTVNFTLGAPNGGVTVNLATNTATNSTVSQTDTVINFENVVGSFSSDSITGDNNANSLWGENGNDTIFGAGGNDIIFGGWGNDLIYGGAGNDTITLNTGGANDADTVFFVAGDGTDTLNGWEDGLDKIDLTGFTGAQDVTSANFASLVNITKNSATQFTATVNGVTIIINGTANFDITQADFVV